MQKRAVSLYLQGDKDIPKMKGQIPISHLQFTELGNSFYLSSSLLDLHRLSLLGMKLHLIIIPRPAGTAVGSQCLLPPAGKLLDPTLQELRAICQTDADKLYETTLRQRVEF